MVFRLVQVASPAMLPLIAVLLVGCNKPGPEVTAGLVDVATRSGLVFRHDNGARGELFYPEIMGSGVALLDYDNDGDLDVYLVQGHELRGDQSRASNKLFRNELVPSGELRFVDVTDQSGLGDDGYGMGVAVGDIDRDGFVDLFVSNFGPNRLYRNNGDGSFSDITVHSGILGDRWSTSSAFIDIERDGDLDLYVGNYTLFTVENNQACFHKDGRRDYCGPDIYPGVADQLFENLGDGRFGDITAASGIAASLPALGVAAVPGPVGTGMGILVANDARANYLWRRNADGSYRDVGTAVGVAYNADGRAEASMGIAQGDYDGDGDEDLFLSHLATETNTLYQQHDPDYYVDVTDLAGLGLSSLPYTGFGTAWVDLDNDGWLDLFIANGAVIAEELRLGVSDFPYEQHNQWYRNNGNGQFVEVPREHEPALGVQAVSRGLAVGDLDNDGDSDLVITNNRGPVQLLRNERGQDNYWIGIDLRSGDVRGEHAGIRVAAGERKLFRRARRDGSYLSAGDPRVIIGLGSDGGDVDVLIEWHGLPAEVWQRLRPGQYWRLEPGEGTPVAVFCTANVSPLCL